MKAKERAIAQREKSPQPFAAPPLNWQDAVWLWQTVGTSPKLVPIHDEPMRPNGLYRIYAYVAGEAEDMNIDRLDTITKEKR